MAYYVMLISGATALILWLAQMWWISRLSPMEAAWYGYGKEKLPTSYVLADVLVDILVIVTIISAVVWLW